MNKKLEISSQQTEKKKIKKNRKNRKTTITIRFGLSKHKNNKINRLKSGNYYVHSPQ